MHQTQIQSQGFRSLEQGERVEFRVGVSERTGRPQAEQVTGPGGVDIVARPRPPPRFGDEGW